jgi:hypothetical protein
MVPTSNRINHVKGSGKKMFASSADEPKHMQPCIFKCYDLGVEMVGRYDREKKQFVVQAGVGSEFIYDRGVTWHQKLHCDEYADRNFWFPDQFLETKDPVADMQEDIIAYAEALLKTMSGDMIRTLVKRNPGLMKLFSSN